ncbi:MAG: ribonuclease HII, partial [Pseudomonadota bacterium]
APVAGVDEAGRGPLAGPVVAAAVIIDRSCAPMGVRDSKTLSEQRRDTIAAEIRACAAVGVGIATVEEIDEINILQASLLAMARAVADLPTPPTACLIDGNFAPELPCPAHPIVKGDAKSLSIAAASIIAKTTRDHIMKELAQEFPHYAWAQNKGYGAPAHKQALREHGVTPHHRKSFAPIRDILCADS